MLSQLLKVVACILVTGAAFILAFVVASAPSLEGATLGTRGAKRRLALRDGNAWSSLEPLIRWLGSRFNLLLPARENLRIDTWLQRAGDPLGMGPAEFVGLSLFIAGAGAGIGLVHGLAHDRNPLGYMLVLAFMGAILTWLRIESIRTDRVIAVQRRLPPSVDILCLGLSAGLDFPAAVRQLIEKSGSRDDPLIGELAIVFSELQLGKSRREALLLFAERNPTTSVREFVASVVQAERSGTPLATVLKIQAEASRRRRSVMAEETATKTGMKLMIPMLMIFCSVIAMLMGPLVLKMSEVIK